MALCAGTSSILLAHASEAPNGYARKEQAVARFGLAGSEKVVGLESDRRREQNPNLLKAAKIEKGSPRPQADKVGKLTRAQLEEIAKTKQKDLTAADLDAAVRTIAGSARSMGIIVEGV